jgi:phage tail sheath gpL-like
MSSDDRAGGGPMVTLSIGAAIANNTITDTVRATSDGASVYAAGAVQLTTTAQPTTTALSVATALSLELAPASFSFAGGGASSTNTIHNESDILGAGVSSPSTVTAGEP